MIKRPIPLSLGMLSAALLTVSCGGSGEGAPTDETLQTNLEVGDLAARGRMLRPTEASSGALVSVTGLAGDLTGATLRDLTPTLEESTIAFASEQSFLRAIDGDGANLRELAVGTSALASIDFNSTGSRIYFADDALKYVASSGGAATQIFPAGRRMSLSPGGTLIAFCPYDGIDTYIKTVSTSGTGPGLIGSAYGENKAVEWLDNDRIVYINGLGIGLIHKDGTGQLQLRNGGDPVYARALRTSPDRRSLAVVGSTVDGPCVEIVDVATWGITFPQDVLPLPAMPRAVTWTPDSRDLVILYENGTIATLGAIGYPKTIYTQLKPSTGWASIDLAGPPAERVLVGASALFSSNAAGILLSQSSSRVFAALAWDATTRSTSTATFEKDASNDHTIIYRIEADTITRLSYTQNNSFKFNSAIGAGPVNGALISFDGNTGAVASVVTYKETRGMSKPSIQKSGSSVVVTGQDLTFLDARTGKSTSGLTTVELR